MSRTSANFRPDEPLDTQPFSYQSTTLKRFLEDIETSSDGRLLDLGPVFKDNINFFSHRVHRLYVCDLYRRLNQDLAQEITPRLSEHLDYPNQMFQRILFWDLPDRLNDSLLKPMVKICFEMTAPGGIAMVLTMGDQVSPGGQNALIVRDDFQLSLRPLVFQHLTAHFRQNRDIMHLLSPFTPLKSLIYRNGVREFLFQRD